MVTVLVFNQKSLKRERKNFRTEAEADAFYAKKFEKNKENLVCEPREKYFTYVNEWNTRIMVQKMY